MATSRSVTDTQALRWRRRKWEPWSPLFDVLTARSAFPLRKNKVCIGRELYAHQFSEIPGAIMRVREVTPEDLPPPPR